MRLGEYQKLVVIKKVEFGVYLAERMEDETRVLLPEKQVRKERRSGMNSGCFSIRILRTGSLRRQTHRS